MKKIILFMPKMLNYNQEDFMGKWLIIVNLEIDMVLKK
jgi:hypothetical protein